MDARLQQVVVDLLERFPVDQVVEEALAEVRADVPAFALVDPLQMREDVAGALALAAEVMRRGVDEGGLESDALRTIGAMRAEQGVDVDALLMGFRIVARTAIDAVLDLAREQDVDAQATLELTRAVWVHCDAAAAALAAGHRAFTDAPARRPVQPAQAALRRLVRGDLAPEALAAACGELGLDPAGTFHVVLVSGTDLPPEADFLASYQDSSTPRVVGLADRAPRDAWPSPVGYGDPTVPGELRRSFQGALVAWEMADAFGLSEPQHPDDVQLLRAVHDLPELGDRFVDRSLGHLDPPRREATRETLRSWFAAQGSADAAADALFVHRNTLRYRLRMFSDATGLNLDHPEDAFTVWWALRRLDLLDRTTTRR